MQRAVEKHRVNWLAPLILMTVALNVQGVTNSWTGTTGNWNDTNRWSLGHAPQNGEDVVITNSGAGVILSNATFALSSFSLSKTLTFTNWDSILSATNITVLTGGIMKLPGPFTNAAGSNNIYVVCSNLTIQSGAVVDANGSGYRGGLGAVVNGYGPGGGGARSGGGHGGRGGNGNGGNTNDNFDAPVLPGSGGALEQAGDPGAGGAGGGVIRVQATGRIDLNGIVRANGASPSSGWNGTSGGAGGSIWLVCGTLTASNGIVQACGGRDIATGGGGGGGCIAISYDTNAQALLPKQDLRLSANFGIGGYGNGGVGTLWVPDAHLLSESGTNFNFRLYGLAEWAPDHLTITNAWLGIPGSSVRLAVTNAMRLSGSSARLDLQTTNASMGSLTVDNGILTLSGVSSSSPSLLCRGDLMLTNAARLYVYAALSNGTAPGYGALVTVSNAMTVGVGATVYPYANTNDGSTVLFRGGSVTVMAGGFFNADLKGYPGLVKLAPGLGPGAGGWKSGGGYGGKGGGSSGGNPYGSSNAPIDCGSSGGAESTSYGVGGYGGGSIRIDATGGTVRILGTLTATGGCYVASMDGGGSGGGIYLICQTLLGNGTMNASGGAGGAGSGGGGGGGGRIALSCVNDGFTGIAITPGGGGYSAGQTGTVVRPGDRSCFYSLHVTGNPTSHGTASPYDYTLTLPHNVFSNSTVTNIVNSPADEANGTRYLCLGWTLTNNIGVMTNGATPEAVFEMTTNLVLTYVWTNSHYLTVSSGTNGQLLTNPSGWYTNGATTNATGIADAGYHFLQWSGLGVSTGLHTVNPLPVVMDRPRTIQANFASNSAITRTWSGTGTWLDPARWSPVGLPSENDTVIIPASTTCLVADPTRAASVTVRTNGTLSFTNWTAMLVATNVTITSNGVITVAGSFTDSQMSNRVYIVCRDLTIYKGGSIYVKELGYARAAQRVGWGPGKGGWMGGGGHGGVGANSTAPYGQTYGDSNAPAWAGSSGGAERNEFPATGGGGGGAVWIEASYSVTLDGTINADGGDYVSYSGSAGGSGGSIYIRTLRFGGSGGSLWARGGNAGTSGPFYGGGGGGGRIAVWRGLDRSSGIQASVAGGSATAGTGGVGSLVWRFTSAFGTIITLR
jgi:hypothetical protein